MSALPRPPDFKTLFESAPGLYLVLDLEMRIVALTDAYARATRTRREEILGRVVFEVFPDNPDDPGNAIGQTMTASFERVLRDRTCDVMPVLRYDLPRPAAAGGGFEQRHWSPANYPILAADGSVSGFIHSLVDVTELHRSETRIAEQIGLNKTLRDSRRAALNLMEDAIVARRQAEQVSAALRASECNERQRAAELAVLMDATPLPIFIVHDPDGMHITGNRAADELLRNVRGAESSLLAPDEIKPRQFRGVKDGRDVTNEEWLALIAGRGLPVRDLDFSLAFDDGTSRDVLGYSSPLRNEDGQPRGAIVVLVDITERMRAETALLRLQADLREFASEVQLEREQEKTSIARELHDELGQALTALKMDVMWVMEKLSAGQETLVEKLEKMLLLLNGTVTATRRIAANLRPLMLDDLGVVAAADWLVKNFSERSGIECRLSIIDPELHLAEPYATAVFRILQEALTNIAKHAKAALVEISIGEINGEVLLSVADNGLGFSTTAQRKPDSFGLMGVRERVYLLNGSVDITSAPGQGTVINVRIPLAQPVVST